jgi:hypothetical protein
MQLPNNIQAKKIVTDTLQKAEAFLGVGLALVFLGIAGAFGYFYSENFLSLSKTPQTQAVPLSPDLENLRAKIGITFIATDGLKKNVQNLEDNTERIVGGVKGRSNPFNSYASSRPSR